jgi:hypothetical protein
VLGYLFKLGIVFQHIVIYIGLVSTALQTGRSRVPFPMELLEFFSDLILLVALWPWGRLSL